MFVAQMVSRVGVIFAIVVFFGMLPVAAAGDWEIAVQFSRDVRSEPYTGRVYLFFSKQNPVPRMAVNWFRPEPILALDVDELKPGESVTFQSGDFEKLQKFPADLSAEQIAGLRVQAVMRFNPWEREANTGAGNGFSEVVAIPAKWNGTRSVSLTVDKVIPKKEFLEGATIKLFDTPSALLKEHYGHEVTLSAAIMLPRNYANEPERRYPVMYVIPGFGGTHFDARTYLPRYSDADTGDVEFIRVLLDASCPEGHHVFANSANNGPWLTALVTEFLPEFEKSYRTVAGRDGRFLTGHSSGGWSSLWIMLNAPEQFAGVWSTAPDSVTFSDFSGIDLNAPGANVYRDADGNLRPLGRQGDQILMYYQSFDQMETILGYGGQLRSFEAVFGSKGSSGPTPAWSRETGKVDAEALQHWQQYDIVKFVEKNWDAKQDLYRDRLHVHMGDEDTFYLDGACRVLQKTLVDRGQPNAVTMYPNLNHFSLLNDALMQQINEEMAAHFRKHYTEDGRAR